MKATLDYKKKLTEVQHIFHVSLKGSKGLENIKIYLESIAELYDIVISLFLSKLERENKIEEIPDAPLAKAKLFLNFIDDEEIKKYMEEYRIIRKLINCDLRIVDEYRKTVRVICNDIEINQESLKKFLENVQNFVNKMEPYIK